MFENIFKSLLEGMGSDLFAKTTNIITAISPLFASAFGIYIMIVVLNTYNRGFDDNFVDLIKRAMGWLIIIACAFNANQYLKIANMLYELPEYMAGLINQQSYTAAALDNNIDRLFDSMGQLWGQKENIPTLNIAERIAFTIMWVFIFLLAALFLTAVAAFYLVAKISLAMVILIGPIFIGAMLFPATRQWGMNWIGQIMNYAVTVTFYVLIGTIQLAFFENHMITMVEGSQATTGALGNLFDIAMFFPMFFLYVLATIIFFVVVLSVPSIAAALTGGATIGGYSSIARTISSASNYLNKRSSLPNKSKADNEVTYKKS